MGRNLLSCPFFVLLFLQGRALQSPLGVGQETQGGVCTARSPNGSALGEPFRGCTAGLGDRSKYLDNMVPMHPQGGGGGLRAVELHQTSHQMDTPEPPGPPEPVHPRTSPCLPYSQDTGLCGVLGAAERTGPRWVACEGPWHRKEETRMIGSPQGQTEDLSSEMNSGSL